MAFNLTRSTATLTKFATLARAATATIRRKLSAVPAQTSSPTPRLALGNGLASALRRRLPPARHRDLSAPTGPNDQGPTLEEPGRPAAHSRPERHAADLTRTRHRHPTNRWIEAKPVLGRPGSWMSRNTRPSRSRSPQRHTTHPPIRHET